MPLSWRESPSSLSVTQLVVPSKLTVSKSRVGWGGGPTLLEEDSFKVCLVAILMVYKVGLGWRKSLKPACTKPCVT